MGLDYALVHVKYTIPPCLFLTLLYRPVFSQTDLYKTFFLITVAVISTIPWDSYLIRSNIWSYPQDAVLGPTFFDIPIEELFFFVIQTYGVCLLYHCISKPTLKPLYLSDIKQSWRSSFVVRYGKLIGILIQLSILYAFYCGLNLMFEGSKGSYIGLILLWATPFMFLLWSLTYDFILRSPLVDIFVPIWLPTVYLWTIDAWALQRGTWVIVPGTKLGIQLWDGLEIEEAVFFWATNTMVVLGLFAFDKAMAIHETFPEQFPYTSSTPSPILAMKALLLSRSLYDQDKLIGLNQAAERLKRKSRSFYLASSAFSGQLRIDLIQLYAYCRIADDLVDGANSSSDAKLAIEKLQKHLDLAYKHCKKHEKHIVDEYITKEFPKDTHLTLQLLPTDRLSKQPLLDLLKGFEMDLQFYKSDKDSSDVTSPIKTDADLIQYGKYVAGTVAELCLDLVFFHHPLPSSTNRTCQQFKDAGVRMGIALQTINIARDVQVDADIGRVYIPSTWLKDAGLKHEDILREPKSSAVGTFRVRLLDLAFDYYEQASPAIEDLPRAARGPMRMAIESYMEIGRVLRKEGYVIVPGKATVPKFRRLWVGWKALNY